MANLEKLQDKVSLRQHRFFSEDFKKKKVAELDRRLTTIAEICREYEVSNTAVYKWIYKYSVMRKKNQKVVVEAKSDTRRIKAMKDHIAELEQLVGKQQFVIEFLEKQMDLAKEQYGIDLKKKPSGALSSGSGNTATNTPIR